MDGCSAINFVKHVLFKLALFAQHDGVSGSFHIKATNQNLDEDNFDILYKNDCLPAIPDPILMTKVLYERKMKCAIIH